MTTCSRIRRTVLGAVLLFAGPACSDGTGPPHLYDTPLELVFLGLPTLDSATEGQYEGWVINSEGDLYSTGRFTPPAVGALTLTSPIDNPEHFMVTVEPPADDDDNPSPHKLMGGKFDGLTAQLGINPYVTGGPGVSLEPNPGTHVLSKPGYTSQANAGAGIWLFTVGRDTLDPRFYATLSLLTEGWSYEGWVVYDYGTPNAVWVSYGKFRSDGQRRAKGRDDTGLGPYSGHLDYRYTMPYEIIMPGDDWVSNPHNLPVPGGLSLPFDLNGDATGGAPSRWTHVITIEPWGPNRPPEMPHEARPFFLAPYRNAIGEAAADQPRTIEYRAEGLPSGSATLKPSTQ